MRNFFLSLFFSGIIFFLSCQKVEPPSIPVNNINLFVTESLNPDSPFYACGDHLWTRHAWQWGAGETLFWHLQDIGRPLPIEIAVNGLNCTVKGGNCFAAYQEAESEPSAQRCNMALNVFQQGYPLPLVVDFDNSVWYPINGTPTSRLFWQGGAAGGSSIWYGVDFGRARQIQHLIIELAAPDLEPRLGLPREMQVEYFSKGGWRPVNSKSSQPLLPAAGKNVLTFSPLFARKIRVVFQKTAEEHIGLIRFQVSGEAAVLPVIKERKFISGDDVFVSLLTLKNPSWHDSMQINIRSWLNWADHFQQGIRIGQIPGKAPIWLAADSDLAGGESENPKEIFHLLELAPREEIDLRFVLAVSSDKKVATTRVRDWLTKIRPLDKQQAGFFAKIESSFPGFFSSERWLNKLYYQRVLMMLRGFAAERLLEDSGDYKWTQLPYNDGPGSVRDGNSGFVLPPDIDSARVAGYLDSRKDAAGTLSDDDVHQLWTAFYSRYQSPKSRLDIRILGEQPHQFEAAPLPLNSIGLLDFTFGVLWGLESISENSIRILPVFPADTLHYWAITGINCGKFCCDLVWDAPDSVDRFDDGKDGLQFYINRKYVCNSNQLKGLIYNLGSGQSDK